MMSSAKGLSVLLLTAALLSGCAGLPKPERPIQEGTFSTRRDVPAREGPAGQAEVPPAPQPIVRIIRGKAVDGLEEARSLVGREDDSFPKGMQETLHSLVLRGVPVRTLAESLTQLCGYNVVATNLVADQEITVFLRSLTLRQALESICRLNNIWYREGQGIITLMTRDEYVRDIEVRQSDQTRAFFIRYTNAADMAKVIQAAMGSEVHLAVIEDEEIYGHIDPTRRASVGQGAYQNPELTPAPQTGGASAPPAPASQQRMPGPRVSLQKATGPAAAPNKPLLAILTVFKRNNCIVARSLDAGLLNEMARIIEALDTPTSQVLLEIRILQLTLGDGFESFFDINLGDTGSTGLTGDFATALGLGGSTALASSTVNFLFDSVKIDARIRYFQSQGRAETIATPFLMAANNSKVEFFVGEETPLRDDVTTTTTPVGEQGDTLTTFQVKIVREELGTDVEVTTFINEDGTVTLEFDGEISSPILGFSTIPVVDPKTGQTIQFPLDGKTRSEIKSILTAQSGQSIAIGGIIRETLDLNENKVPILGDIPGLGFFFREINNSKTKTETVIIFTPHVILHPALAGRASDDFLGRKSSHGHITKGKENILEITPPNPETGMQSDKRQLGMEGAQRP